MPQWNRIRDFKAIEDEFLARAHTTVWCNVATVDAKGRPTSRVLHPIWEANELGAPTGWVATRPTSPKARDIQHNPHVSLAYIQDIARPLYVECEAAWEETSEAKQHLWALFTGAAPPLGYDPAPIFGTARSPEFGVLRLTPWRVQLGDPDGTRRTWLR